MTRIITQQELCDDDVRLLEAVLAGETFLITRDGVPIAELRPVRAGRRTFISREAVTVRLSEPVRIDHESFRDDLDGALDQSIEAASATP